MPKELIVITGASSGIGKETAIEKAEKKLGPTGCLVNNAGVMLLGHAHEQDPKEWEKMLDVNVKGLMNGVHAVLKKMYERKEGTIINISTIAGRKTFPQHAAYSASKFAVHAFSESTREEAAEHNVRVVIIAPGVVETELLGHTTSAQIKGDYESWKKEMGQALQAKDISEAILFAYSRPSSVCIREIVIGPTRQGP